MFDAGEAVEQMWRPKSFGVAVKVRTSVQQQLTGHRTLNTVHSHRTVNNGHRTLETEHWTLDTEQWTLGIFLFTTASRTALGPTQPPIQWVLGALSLGREADHSLPSSAEVKEWMELYLHSPNTPSWRGAQLKHRDNFIFTWTLIFSFLKRI
jgi:hypothetical protein